MDTYSEAPHLQADRDTRTIVSGPPGIPEAVIITGQAWYDCYGNVVKVIGVPREQAIASTPMAIQGQVTGDGSGHTVVAEGIETADQADVSGG